MAIELNVDTGYTIAVNKLPLVAKSDGTTISAAVAYNAAGMDLNWNFITLAGVTSQTNVVPTTTGDYDWVALGNGMYTIEIPASGGASINNDAAGWGWFSGETTAEAVFISPVYGFSTDLTTMRTGIIEGLAQTGTLSTTQATTDLTGYADDQLIGRTFTVLTGAAEGEQGQLDDYASAGGLMSFTATPLTTAMGNGDKFKIT